MFKCLFKKKALIKQNISFTDQEQQEIPSLEKLESQNIYYL